MVMRTTKKKTVRTCLSIYLRRSHSLSLLAISLLFSGEEGYGKYLDLYANHTAYTNLKNIGKRPGYLQYLDLLLAAQDGHLHRDLSKETRFSKDFEKCVIVKILFVLWRLISSSYIQNLHAYLLSFAKRTLPLVDVQAQQQEAEVEFNTMWDAEEVRGWEESKQVNGNDAAGIWCAPCMFFLLESLRFSQFFFKHKVKSITRSRQFMTHI